MSFRQRTRRCNDSSRGSKTFGHIWKMNSATRRNGAALRIGLTQKTVMAKLIPRGCDEMVPLRYLRLPVRSLMKLPLVVMRESKQSRRSET